MADSPDVPLLQWALGGVSAGLTAAFSWLWNRLAAVETRIETQLRDVWAAISDDRKTAQASRERMLERLGEMPTKADLAQLENRIAAMLSRHGSGD